MNVAVFFGGVSVEHDISVITGVMTANALKKSKNNVLPIYVDKDGKWYYHGEILTDIDNYKKLNYKKLHNVALLPNGNTLYGIKGKKIYPIGKIDCAINCMHGERGEDGSLAGLLNFTSIPLASPKMLPSSVSMDKGFTKTVLKGLKIKCLEGVEVYSVKDLNGKIKDITYPVIVKPSNLGSSIGITVAKNLKELTEGVSKALNYGEKAVIEKMLEDFTEINCSAYFDGESVVVSQCEKPKSSNKFLTFADKYQGEGEREFPANIEESISNKIKSITKKIYVKMNFDGIIRVDYMVYNGKVYLNEINTVPGSLAYYLFCDTMKEFSSVLDKVIAVAVKKKEKEEKFIKEFSSSVLNVGGLKGSKKEKKDK